ncbi:MAG: xanthine dehydrogenase family protein molybdopterin-binding subunit [Desulfobacterales bacterium]|nr:xanthine dehydrogenase family protein molybdopterin-binding subunit [Desulfobacterales bacterium]
MEEFAFIGKPVPRIDGPAKVTGAATYAGDLILPGMLHGKLLRSPLAHARIVHMDTRRAESLPGVKSVVSGKDFPGALVGFMKTYSDRPPIALDRVRYVGEAVAAVAAVSEDVAEEALDLIDITYEKLEPVLSIEEARREGAPQLHDHAKNNIGAECNFSFGDVDRAFSAADYVREEEFFSQRVGIGFIEPHVALASVDASGRVTFQGTKQSPYITWRQLCKGLRLPLNKIRIINPYVGGAFSGKHDAFDLDFCAVRLAQKTGRPVRITVGQDEILAFYRQRHEKRMWMKLGVSKDGTLLALDCKLTAEGGAYLGVGPVNIFVFGARLTVPYRLPNLRYEAYRFYTNKPVCGAVRGQANAIARYAFESLLSIVADEIGVDQVQIRLKNALKPGETTINGIQISPSDFSGTVSKCAELIDWEKKKGEKIPYRGIGFGSVGMASGGRMGGHFASSAIVKIAEDGTAVLNHGGTEIGQGCDTVFAQMLAEVLGLAFEDVQVGTEDSDTSVFDPGMFGDRCTVWSGNAVIAAAKDARRQIADVAAEMLGVRPEDLQFRQRKVFVKDNPDKSLPFGTVVRNIIYGKGRSIYGTGSWAPDIEVADLSKGFAGKFTPSWAFITQAVEVEVDPETGKVKLLRVAIADESGRPINPALLDGQHTGGVTQMIGHALFEECLFDDQGQPLTTSFGEYKMPTAMDVPEFSIAPVLAPDPVGPFGAKGAGESATCATLPAVANAIAAAIGVRIKDLPITPEKILKAIQEQRAKQVKEEEILWNWQ